MSPVQTTDVNHATNLPSFFEESAIDVEAFAAVCSKAPEPADFPLSETTDKRVVIYDGDRVRSQLSHDQKESQVRKEWCRCLKQGPGVFVVKRAYSDEAVLDSMTDIFRRIITAEETPGSSKGDHFGNNERIWNSFQKSFFHAPEIAVDYYANPILALASRSWLGPNYQITAQVNIVKPGSGAQSPHRDYHLGFQSNETISKFPAHAQIMSQFLTLQGGIAHTNMPLESGPTLLLPYSHQYEMGYLAFRNAEFIKYFDSNKVQLPLEKGDAVFFNPALFHGAGANTSKNDRIGNLVQISSAFGRTMETIDHRAIVELAYPILRARHQREQLPELELTDVLSAVSLGYSFPTNLDADPPMNGNAPQSMQQLLRDALSNNDPLERFIEALDAYVQRHQA